MDALYSMVVAARESRQHQQAQRVLKAYRHLAEVARPEFRQRMQHDFAAMPDVLDQMPSSPGIDLERGELAEALRAASGQRDGGRLNGSPVAAATEPASGSAR